MNELEKQIQIARNFFESNRKGSKENEPCYFRMKFLRNLQGDRTFDRKTPVFYSNMDEPELNNSLDLLKQALELYGPTGTEYFLVSLLKSETSNHDYVVTLKNPYYNSFSPQMIGMMQPQQNPTMMLDMQRQMYEMQMGFMQKFSEMEKKAELKELEDRIEELEGKKNTLVDSIQGFAESSAGEKILDALLGLLKQQPQQQAIQQPVQQQVIQQQVQEQQPQEQQPLAQDVKQSADKIAQSLYKISQVFPDYEDALEDIANYCINHPNIVASLRGKIKE